MFLTPILLPLAALTFTATPAPSPDTPTTTVDSNMMTLFIASGDPSVTGLCDTYGPALNAATVAFGDPNLAADVVDAYVIVSIEDPADMRLTPEARLELTDWLHASCS